VTRRSARIRRGPLNAPRRGDPVPNVPLVDDPPLNAPRRGEPVAGMRLR
jgi:hypothetical protein